MHDTKPVFPFTAIVGQDRMKKSLILNVVNRRIGGVLIRGEKGTAKSTAVRGLAAILPDIEVVEGCPFSCDPDNPDMLCPACAERLGNEGLLPRARRRIKVADLPVGATEDRVLGTLDLERAIKKGERRFEPGILASAHRGVLYVDEVNLLEDHIVDVLLDAAAMGVNTVEREGVSFCHGAEFTLIGTMNPEEGELRPQLLDRFGLCVEVAGSMDLAERMEVVARQAAFEEDPHAFMHRWQAEDRALCARILTARNLLPDISLSEDMLRLVAEIAIGMNVDGHRADIVMMKAAKALAALDGRSAVERRDVGEAAEMALPHRMRRKPFEKIGLDRTRMERLIEGAA
ncbi:MAG: ATP-binding protein [Desulfovibrionaceae bacterium]|nr:ATP-binding protein [Desulfovibrionaceae bacterium]